MDNCLWNYKEPKGTELDLPEATLTITGTQFISSKVTEEWRKESTAQQTSLGKFIDTVGGHSGFRAPQAPEEQRRCQPGEVPGTELQLIFPGDMEIT